MRAPDFPTRPAWTRLRGLGEPIEPWMGILGAPNVETRWLLGVGLCEPKRFREVSEWRRTHRARTHRRSSSSVICHASGTNRSQGASAKRGSNQPSPSDSTSPSITARGSGEIRSNVLWPFAGTNASRYTTLRIRAGTRSATPVMTVPPARQRLREYRTTPAQAAMARRGRGRRNVPLPDATTGRSGDHLCAGSEDPRPIAGANRQASPPTSPDGRRRSGP
jgi:hypothetical protein